jgi:hypothetical protein
MVLDLTESYILTKDLSADDTDYVGIGDSWVPIGTLDYEDPTTLFTGTFDGDNHTISDLIVSVYDAPIGLFGGIGSGSVIKDISLIDAEFTNSGNYTGGIAGVAFCFTEIGISITNCHFAGEIIAGEYVGGIIGMAMGPITMPLSGELSGDTSNLVVGNIVGTFTSANLGETWTNRKSGVGAAYIESDDSGDNLFAAINDRLYISNNRGVTWTETRPLGDVDATWKAIAINSIYGDDGHYELYAASAYGRLWRSVDNGLNWTEFWGTSSGVDRNWRSAFVNYNGDISFGCVYNGRLYGNFGSGMTEKIMVWSLLC